MDLGRSLGALPRKTKFPRISWILWDSRNSKPRENSPAHVPWALAFRALHWLYPHPQGEGFTPTLTLPRGPPSPGPIPLDRFRSSPILPDPPRSSPILLDLPPRPLDRPKAAPRPPQDRSKTIQDRAKAPQDRPKAHKTHPRAPRIAAQPQKSRPRAPKTLPRPFWDTQKPSKTIEKQMFLYVFEKRAFRPGEPWQSPQDLGDRRRGHH